MKLSRTQFLKLTGLTIGTFSTSPMNALVRNNAVQPGSLKIGLASYTLRKLSLDETIKITTRLGFKHIALKAMHLPLESSPEIIRQLTSKVRAAGLDLYGGGVIYMKTKAEVETAFAYAKAAGFNMIIGVPAHELLPFVQEQVKSTNIKLAIHNHGPGDRLYRSVTDVYDKIKTLDDRIGLCIDIGHVQRISENPAALILKYKDRLYDIHLKDTDKTAEDGTSIEIGRGVIDIPAVMKTLVNMNYKGYVAIEYEKDENDPVPGLAESVGYVRGVLKMI
jgi:inosose dehydratase